jgi:hypothetical protein
MMSVLGEIPDIDDPNVNEFPINSFADNAIAERRCNHIWEDGQNVNDH